LLAILNRLKSLLELLLDVENVGNCFAEEGINLGLHVRISLVIIFVELDLLDS